VNLCVGRWAQTATAGVLTCGALPAAEQLPGAWSSITTGSFRITINGGAPTNITGINFSGQTTMQGVAGVIQAALQAQLFNLTTCVWNAAYGYFVITSPTTGNGSSVSFLSGAGSGVDISVQMAGTALGGAYVANGIAAESAVAAATVFDNLFGQQWYALQMPTISADSDHEAVATFINGTNNKHLYGVTSSEASMLNPADTTNVAYQLQQLALLRSITQFSSSNAYAIASFFGKLLTVNYNASNTTLTMMYKQEPGVVPETLNATQLSGVTGFNANVFVEYNNGATLIQNGVTANGTYCDTVTGTDWLALAIQNTIFNYELQNQTKIPQTDAGTHLIVTLIEAVCSQAVANGLLAPGQWNSGGFGQLNTGDFLPKGFYVYAPQVATQAQSARSARQSVPIQVAAKLAGAIQTVDVLISVNS